MDISEKNQNILIATAASVLLIVVVLNWSRLFPKTSNSSVAKNLAKNAWKHYLLWDQGKRKEGDAKTLDLLNEYWETVGWANRKQSDKISNPWSAAFISHMAKLSGADNFKFSPSHSAYTVQSIMNRVSGKGDYFGYKPDEVPIEIGDIVVKPRSGSNANYSTTGSYASHGDIVVNIKDGVATMIGGNIGNSVGMAKLKLDENNKIAKSEITKNKYFAIIKYK